MTEIFYHTTILSEMIYKRSNKNAATTNNFRLTNAMGAGGKITLQKHVFANVPNLAEMIYLLPDGTAKTKTWGSPANDWKTVKADLEAELIAEGFEISDPSAVKVVTDGTGFDITIKGDITITSITSVSAVTTLLN